MRVTKYFILSRCH